MIMTMRTACNWTAVVKIFWRIKVTVNMKLSTHSLRHQISTEQFQLLVKKLTRTTVVVQPGRKPCLKLDRRSRMLDFLKISYNSPMLNCSWNTDIRSERTYTGRHMMSSSHQRLMTRTHCHQRRPWDRTERSPDRTSTRPMASSSSWSRRHNSRTLPGAKSCSIRFYDVVSSVLYYRAHSRVNSN